MSTISRFVLAAALTCIVGAVPACDDKKAESAKKDKAKDKDKAKAKAKDDGGKEPLKKDPAADPKADPKADGGDAGADPKAAAPAGDALVITASHAEPKPTDPVTVTLTGLKVVEAKFDPKDLTGGTVKIEIDAASLKSDSDMRDNHLKSEDYLDVGKFAAITVDVTDIAKDGEGYKATFAVDAHGKKVEWKALPFQASPAADDSVKVHLEHEFERLAFDLGKVEGDSVGAKIKATLDMTIAKTG